MVSVRALFILCPVLTVSPSSHAQVQPRTCPGVESTVHLDDKSLPLQDYVCKTESQGAEAGVRVRFVRLTGIAAGILFRKDQPPPPGLMQVLTTAEFAPADGVYEAAGSIFQNYGIPRDYETDNESEYIMALEPEGATSASNAKRENATERSLGSILHIQRLSTGGGLSAPKFFIESARETIARTTRWPKDYQMYYGCSSDDLADEKSPKELTDFISCTSIWRYIEPQGLDPVFRDIKEEYRRAAGDDQPDSRVGTESEFDKGFGLLRFLAQKGWKKSLSVLTASYGNSSDECDPDTTASWTVAYTAPELMLDVAVIVNESDRPVRIDGLLGAQVTADSVRPISTSQELAARDPAPLKSPPISLAPKQAIAIGLRIAFVADHDSSRANDDADGLKKIRSWPAGHTFEIDGIRKSRESFLEPKRPEQTDQVYGPEIALVGLQVDGQRLVFEGRRSNIVKSIFRPRKCCPVLYSRIDADGPWLYRGKVIRQANGPENAKVDHIEFSSLRTQFRIAEEEPEASFIDYVRLNLFLHDGRKMTLEPRHAVDRVIYADRATDIDFDLPAGVLPADVARSDLEIAGYFRRYGDMTAARNVPTRGTK
jgi:hypothetical protein